ncbi:MAG: hypothetical protein PUK70_01795 [Bacteroidales bacterium]|nr:hypothetical protein [Bacteroidales bacterium]MDY6002632.1 hypothetical protein [Candidatus Cryptobacteroides sp.]
MSYERRGKNEKNHCEHLESVRSGGCSGAGGKCGASSDGKGGVRLVASADAGNCIRNGRVRRLAPEVADRRKAYEDAMAWLFSPESNTDAWMLKM